MLKNNYHPRINFGATEWKEMFKSCEKYTVEGSQSFPLFENRRSLRVGSYMSVYGTGLEALNVEITDELGAWLKENMMNLDWAQTHFQATLRDDEVVIRIHYGTIIGSKVLGKIPLGDMVTLNN